MKNKRAWVIAVVTGMLVPAALFASTKVPMSHSALQSLGSRINCMVSGACNITVNVQGDLSQDGSSESLGATSVDQTTFWTGGSFSGDLAVGGTLTASGTLQLQGPLLSSQGDYGTFHVSSTMSSATSTPCAVQNTSGRTRTLVALDYTYTSTSAVGAFTITAGTSSSAFVTSTSPLVNTVLTTVAGSDVINTTSSLQSVYAPWKANEWLVFKSGTSTNAGFCRALFY